MKSNKGFTLIELLVVIAIIGILSSVVLASLTTARSKGKDAAIQSQLSSARAQAELYYSTTGSGKYQTGATLISSCTDTATLFGGGNGLGKLLTAITTTKQCNVSADGASWAVAASGETSGTTYCVDNTGVMRDSNSSSVKYTGITSGVTPALAASSSVACN